MTRTEIPSARLTSRRDVNSKKSASPNKSVKLISYLWAVSFAAPDRRGSFLRVFLSCRHFCIKYAMPLRINAAIAGMETTVTTNHMGSSNGVKNPPARIISGTNIHARVRSSKARSRTKSYLPPSLFAATSTTVPRTGSTKRCQIPKKDVGGSITPPPNSRAK